MNTTETFKALLKTEKATTIAKMSSHLKRLAQKYLQSVETMIKRVRLNRPNHFRSKVKNQKVKQTATRKDRNPLNIKRLQST